MLSLGLPHLTVLSKCDMVEDKEQLDLFLNLEFDKKVVDLSDESHIMAFTRYKGDVDKVFDDPIVKSKGENHPKNQKISFGEKYKKLSQKIKEIVFDYNLVSMLPLDIRDVDTISDIIYHADQNIQFGEEREANEKDYKEVEKRMGNPQFD